MSSDVSPQTLALPYAASAARDARVQVVQLLTDSCALPTIETAALLTSELVTNAVLHGSPPLQLRVAITEGLIRVEVHDSSSALPAPRNARTTDPGGRGLTITEALATRWGTQPVDDEKSVWFELTT